MLWLSFKKMRNCPEEISFIRMTSFMNLLKALSHYNVLANLCQHMENLSITLAYAVIEFKKSEKASTGTYTNDMLNDLNEYERYI